jgi:hypothetical protein
MLVLDDLSMSDPRDPRTCLIVDMLTKNIPMIREVHDYLQAAGMNPGIYDSNIAGLAWQAAVPDAVKQGQLSELIARIVEKAPAFGTKLEERLQGLRSKQPWYHDDNPYASSLVGHGDLHAVIDREKLRNGLRDLARDDSRILLVSGKPRSGKSHTWVLMRHLRDAKKLTGEHRFVRVTTHGLAGEATGDEVTGEALASELADKLGLNIWLNPSGELADARARKLVNMIVGNYPQNDGVTRWIILDGLDRPGVQDSARDVAKRLITLVAEEELPQTRLIVTGLDTLGLTVGYAVPVEQIQAIDKKQVREFLVDVAKHLNRVLAPVDLDAYVAEILGTGKRRRDLYQVEQAVLQRVKSWTEVQHDE